MSIIQVCTGCGSRLKAPESAIGRVLKCPRCGDSIRVRSDVEPEPDSEIDPDLQIDNEAYTEAKPNSHEVSVPKGRDESLRYSIDSAQGRLEVFDDYVTITPQGVLGFLNHGLKGTKSIRFSSVTGLQFRLGGSLTNGYLQFTIAGGVESRGGLLAATSDENSFIFKHTLNEIMAEVKEFIEQRLKEPTPVNNAAQPANSLSNEIAKLVELKQQGFLTDEEFLAAKAKLLDR